jgi:hypothetical protein
MVVCACYSSDIWKPKIGRSWSTPAYAKSKTYLQNNLSKKGWRHNSRPRKKETLSSNLSIAKKKNQTRKHKAEQTC